VGVVYVCAVVPFLDILSCVWARGWVQLDCEVSRESFWLPCVVDLLHCVYVCVSVCVKAFCPDQSSYPIQYSSTCFVFGGRLPFSLPSFVALVVVGSQDACHLLGHNQCESKWWTSKREVAPVCTRRTCTNLSVQPKLKCVGSCVRFACVLPLSLSVLLCWFLLSQTLRHFLLSLLRSPPPGSFVVVVSDCCECFARVVCCCAFVRHQTMSQD